MFKVLVLLKVSPWFLYADNESDALKLCEQYKDDAAGIVTGENIIVKKPRMALTLEQEQVLQLPYERKMPEYNCDEQLEIDIAEAAKEIDDEFAKLQSSVD